MFLGFMDPGFTMRLRIRRTSSFGFRCLGSGLRMIVKKGGSWDYSIKFNGYCAAERESNNSF